jgi:hypothetical protein
MFVHSLDVRSNALALISKGLNDCEVARRTGIPRSTIRDWRTPAYLAKTASYSLVCPRCWQPAYRRIDFTDADYAELLGLYLGDGHITNGPRTQRLRICLDSAYPTILSETHALLQRCFQQNKVGAHREDGGAMTVVWVYSRHLGCLFPQHGPGKKHDRPIVLDDWQARIVGNAPWDFLRGCIRSDGCVFINPTGRYRYLSYDFRNRSDDIRQLFTQTCDLVGVQYYVTRDMVRVCRRESVELFAANVGIKR